MPQILLAKGDAWGVFPPLHAGRLKNVASAVSCLDPQGRQPIVSESHSEEKAGAFIKKEGAAVPC